MLEKREWLLRDIRARLLPLLKQSGFDVFGGERQKGSVELRRSFPFGFMKRRKGDAVELLEVQIDAHGAPKFVLNFGSTPPGGVDLPWGQHLDEDELTVSALRDAYRLYRRPQ